MSGALDFRKEIAQQLKDAGTYRKTSEDKAAHDEFQDRKDYLKAFRKGTGIEDIWSAADKAYVPHKLSAASAGRKILVSNDELGWRSAPVNLSVDDEWQEDSVPPNPYIKIQTAMGIIVDGNPTAVMSPGAKKYENNSALMENLYTRTWEIAHSRQAVLKPFVFNTAKYGMGIARTFPYAVTKTVEEIISFDPSNPKKTKYKEVEHTYFDDVFRESLNPWTVWLDDNSKVGDPFSCNDAVYYKDYSWSKLKRSFGHLYNFKYIRPQKKVLMPDGKMELFVPGAHKNFEPKYQERVWFWENFDLDLLFVMTDDGVCLVNEPLPQQAKNKKISLWYAPWTLRDDSSPYGIGIYEAMRNDHKLHTKIRNMTMDQLVLSIYREFFYSGTDTLEGDGVMRIRPGRGRQVSDPKNMKWSDVPPPGQEAWQGLAYQEGKMDDATAINKTLEGQITGRTAFEISQARESAMKRLKTPLENITDALEQDAYITLGIIEDLYSVPKIKLLADDRYITPFEMDTYEKENGQQMVEGTDFNYEHREVPLNVQRDTGGKIVNSGKTEFFTLKPDDLPWEGIIKIDGQSIVANSELLDRTSTVEMANLIVPLFTAPPQIAKKPATEIIKSYKKDPADWLPDVPGWNDQPIVPPAPNLFVKQGADGQPAPTDQGAGGAPPAPQDLTKTGMSTVVGGPPQAGAQSPLLNAGGSQAAAIITALGGK